MKLQVVVIQQRIYFFNLFVSKMLKGDYMEMTIRELIETKIKAWNKVAWGNQDIMLCLDCGSTKASEIHRLAVRQTKGIIKALKNKVKSDSVCQLLGINRQAEISKLVDSLNIILEREKDNEKI